LNLAALTVPILLALVGIGFSALVVGAVLAARASSPVKKRLSQFLETETPAASQVEGDGPSGMAELRRQFNIAFGALDSVETRRRLTAAAWPITVSEFWFLRVGAAVLVFMLALVVFRAILPAVGIGALAYMVPGFMLFRGIQKRQRQFQNQLIDCLTLVRGGVAAGYSFQQALNIVIQEMQPPAAEEFRQVRREVELGIPLSRALENMAARMESDDFNLVVNVVVTNIQVGGNLSTILNVVMDTIRERIALLSEVRALTAYANFASYLLTMLPFATVLALALLSPVYWEQLFDPGATRIALIYALCSLVVGNILLRRIAKVKI
jgi:tight adherence protein B